MAKACKPVSMNNGHITNDEIQSRKEAEQQLKGSNDLVYTPPEELKTKAEKELYHFLVSEMKAANILNNLDIQILVQTVDCIIKMREANKLIKKYGMVTQKPDGTLQKNPACTIYKEYNSIFYQCCMQLGLSPSSRSKLALDKVKGKEKEQDPVLSILKKNKAV